MGTSSLSVAVVVSLGIASQAPDGTAVVEPMVTVDGADVEQRARLDDALARFDSAGLRLADFEIIFSDDESVCAGHLGGFRDRDDTPHVSVCSDLEFVVLHELAHVWIDANLDEVARDEYVRARGVAAWSDHSVPWAQRGVEDAAFVVQQNLRDVAPSSLASATWADRIAAFELLTGVPSPLRSRSPSPVVAPPSGAVEQSRLCRRLFSEIWHVTTPQVLCPL